jgi:hypothetical protein
MALIYVAVDGLDAAGRLRRLRAAGGLRQRDAYL